MKPLIAGSLWNGSKIALSAIAATMEGLGVVVVVVRCESMDALWDT